MVGILLTGLAWAQPSPMINLNVQGEVGSPGVVQLDGEEAWPLIRALAKVGGLNEGAAWDRINIRRGDKTFTVGRYSAMSLQNGDAIYVEKLRATLVRPSQTPQKIHLTHRTLPGLLGPDLPDYRGIVVHASSETHGQNWSRAEFFDGTVRNRIKLGDDDTIVLSKRNISKPIRATIDGEVRVPGEVRCSAASSLLDLLCLSGGFAPNADPEGAVLVRNGREQSIPNILTLSTMKLLPRDTLKIVPLRNIEIRVVGEVQNEGHYLVTLASPDQLRDAVKAAGGVKETAAIHRIVVWRPREHGDSPLLDLDKGSTALQQGDTLWIEEMHCNISGAVSRPGEVPLTGSENLATVIESVGPQEGRVNTVKLLRSSDLKRRNVRWQTFDLSEPAITSKIRVEDGDYLHVLSSEDDPSLPLFYFPTERFQGVPFPLLR